MAEKGFKRKLTAILSADVEGYSRLMDDDEEATVRTLTTYRNAIDDLVQQYRGRVVDTPGDNILAEFASVVDAVNCAVEIQRELAERNAELTYNRMMEFRIGVNLGDVIEEEGRIYGDGVNIAARVESMSEAGGICISGRAYDQVANKLGLEYENLGEHQVKNISTPIRVYRVLSYPGAAAHRVVQAKKVISRKWHNLAIAGGTIAVVMAIAVGIWQFYLRPSTFGPASAKRMVLPLPDRPSLAVLPFVDMSKDKEYEFLSDGITEDIITALSKIPRFFVIARESVFEYKGKAVKVQQIGRELGVRHVLQGSIQKAGDRLRITGQLADAETGQQVWAEHYDRPFGDLFALQDDITFNILEAMQVELTEGDQTRIHRKGTQNMDAYIRISQGRKHAHRFNKEGNAIARQLAEEAVTLDPDYAMAYWLLAKTHYMDIWFGMTKSPKDSITKAWELNQRAIALDDDLTDAYGLLSSLYIYKKRDFDRAIMAGERAVAVAPNSADAYAWLGMAMQFSGMHEKAIPIFKKAIRLNPFPQTWYYTHLGGCYCTTGQYEEALSALQKAIQREPDNLFAYLALCYTYEGMGRGEEARAMVSEVYRVDPKFSLTQYEKVLVQRDEKIKKRYIDSLRKAGLK
jgi:adenylate cyclase